MKQEKSEAVLKVERDHETIRHQMGKLNVPTAEEIRPQDFSDWKLKFTWQLRDFKNRMLKHFDLEEEGGFMQDVLDVAPHSGQKVDQLKDEHEQIIKNLDRLTMRLKGIKERDDSHLDKIRAGLSKILSDIRAHENEEHILIQKAYYREYGGET